MEKTLEKLIAILTKDDRLVSEDGKLLKNKLQELVRKNDPLLLKTLLVESSIKKIFFDEIEGATIFDKDKFIQFINTKEFLPDSYTAFTQKINLSNDNSAISKNEEVVLNFPYKDCVLEGGMTKEDQKRDEVFFNNVIAPDQITRLLDEKAFTQLKRIDKNGEKDLIKFNKNERDEITDNLIIKGNNLIGLYSLKKNFTSKVKLIYIDPPYNTGSDSFGYNDKFNHSSWLVFMKNRFEIAKKLLREDGFIYVQIKDTELAYLKVLMDEVFEDGFVSCIAVKMSHLSGPKMAHIESTIPSIKEYILVYTKNKGKILFNDVRIACEWDEAFDRYGSYLDKNGSEDPKKWVRKSIGEVLKSNGLKVDSKDKDTYSFLIAHADLIFRTARNKSKLDEYQKLKKDVFHEFKNTKNKTYYVLNGEEVSFASDKIREIDGKKVPTTAVSDIWLDIGINNLANEGGVDLENGKKPEKLLQRIIEMVTVEGDLVLDYHAGSGTTLAVAHKMGRQYIGIEQLDYEDNNPESRLKNVINGDSTGISKSVNWKGGGEFVYMQLAKWNEVWIDKITQAKSGKVLVDLWGEMKQKAFFSYRVDIKAVDTHAKSFEALSIEDKKRFLIESLDMNFAYVNYSDIEDKTYNISKEDKKINKEFYGRS